MATLEFSRHYETLNIKDIIEKQGISEIEFVLKTFDKPIDYDLNWLFLSTSGVHGSYATLDDIENCWDIIDENHPEYHGHNITVLIVLPRLVTIYYGNIQIETAHQIQLLREIVQNTIDAVIKSQMKNTLEKEQQL